MSDTETRSHHLPDWAGPLVACLAAGLVGVVSVVLLRHHGAPFLTGPRAWFPLGLLGLAALCAWRARRRGEALGPAAWFAWTILGLLGLFYCSSGPEFVYHHLQTHTDWLIPGKGRMRPGLLSGRLALVLGLAAALTLARLLAPGGRAWWRWGLGAMLVFGVVWCGAGLWIESGGEAVYRDDHPSFMQRLHVFARSFPQMLYYDPYWDGGKAQSYLVSSGTTAPGLLAWPLWRFGEIHRVYTPGLLWLYLVVTPAALMGAVRLAGGGWTAALAAGVLGIGATRYTWLWQLHFGTVGFSVAMPFLVVALACLHRVLVRGRTEWWLGLLLVGSGYLYLSWPAGVLMAALPVAMVTLPRLFHLDRRQVVFLGVCAAALALLLLPHLFAVLNHSRLDKLGGIEKPAGSMLDIFRGQMLRGHPWLLVGGLLGVLGLRGEQRGFFGLALLGLFLAMVVGGAKQPQFELERASIPLFLTAVVPAALLLESWWESGRAALAAPAAAATGLLLPGILAAGDLYRNQALECWRDDDVREDVAPVKGTRFAYVDEFVEWARTAPRDGRIAFLGQTKSAYGRAHSAYLPVWAGRPMLACDYYDFPPGLVELDMPPSPYRQAGIAGWTAWFERWNVHYLVTYHEDKKAVMRSHPEVFTEVFQFGVGRTFHVYEIDNQCTWFLGNVNSGEVEADINRIRVRLEDPRTAATLRFNWEEGLRASGDAVVRPSEPYKVDLPTPGGTVSVTNHFVRLVPNGESEVTITYRKLR